MSTSTWIPMSRKAVVIVIVFQGRIGMVYFAKTIYVYAWHSLVSLVTCTLQAHIPNFFSLLLLISLPANNILVCYIDFLLLDKVSAIFFLGKNLLDSKVHTIQGSQDSIFLECETLMWWNVPLVPTGSLWFWNSFASWNFWLTWTDKT